MMLRVVGTNKVIIGKDLGVVDAAGRIFLQRVDREGNSRFAFSMTKGELKALKKVM